VEVGRSSRGRLDGTFLSPVGRSRSSSAAAEYWASWESYSWVDWVRNCYWMEPAASLGRAHRNYYSGTWGQVAAVAAGTCSARGLRRDWNSRKDPIHIYEEASRIRLQTLFEVMSTSLHDQLIWKSSWSRKTKAKLF
jgi:hypothetical protein